MENFKWIRKYFLEIGMLAVVLIWSSNNAVMKIGIEQIGPFTYNANAPCYCQYSLLDVAVSNTYISQNAVAGF